jgi:3-dehydroquinate synthase
MSATETVRLDLGERSYDIHVGAGLLARAGGLVAPLLKRKRVFVVTDANVAPLHLATLQQSLAAAGIEQASHVLPAGEHTKSFGQLEQLLEVLLDARCERSTTLIALGGGVIGDLVGFAASILLRGVDFIQMPTTLLSQVDSSVGGKTGINTRQGKNLVGSFYQPRLVLADTATLATLPRREVSAGYAEVAKYGVIDDPAFWAWLEDNGAAVVGLDDTAIRRAVVTSCRAKARVVGADERESGFRALLNLGHTFGHALEAETGYGPELLHGEAVAIGMVLAMRLSARLGLCPAGDAERVRAHLAAVGLPTRVRDIPGGDTFDPARLVEHMGGDKKVEGGKVTFVLAHGIGRAMLSRDVPLTEVAAVLAESVGRNG